jgi:hypothetical protein
LSAFGRQFATPPVASGDLKNAFPKGRRLPLKARGELLRILESKNGKKENHPVLKRSNLGFAFASRSENHPVFLPIFDWQKATPP